MRVPLKISLMLLLIGLSLPMLAQSLKGVCYVNLQQIQKQLPAYTAAKGQIETFSKQTMTDLNRQQKELEQRYKASVPRKDTAMHQATLRRESAAYFQQVALKQREIIERTESTLATVDEMIKKVVAEIAREEGYNGVLDIGTMIYYDQRQDITVLVLKRLGVK